MIGFSSKPFTASKLIIGEGDEVNTIELATLIMAQQKVTWLGPAVAARNNIEVVLAGGSYAECINGIEPTRVSAKVITFDVKTSKFNFHSLMN